MNTQDLPTEVLKRLDALAAKTGETVEYMWPQYVEYVYWDHLVGTLACTAIITMVLLVNAIIWLITRGIKDTDERVSIRAIAVVVGGIITIICLAVSVSQLPGVFAPEGAAIQEVIP
jgi:hypothetical protein